jgi:hypothetical protein
MEYTECFGLTEGGAGFNMEILKEREKELLSYIGTGDKKTISGYYVWNIDGVRYTSKEFVQSELYKINGITDDPGKAYVEFVEHPEGRFNLSLVPVKNNRRYHDGEFWCPENPLEYTHSADPFRYLTETQIKDVRRYDPSPLSKGGIAVLRERDLVKDPLRKSVKDVTTFGFVSDYLYRPTTTQEFGEDAIMQMVFFGGLMFPETNVENLVEYIRARGFGGYLLYMTDANGEISRKPGFNTGTASKQELFTHGGNWVNNYAGKDNHIDIIQQFIKIKGMSDMTNQDLFTAACGCLYGSSSRMRDYMNESRNSQGSEHFFPEFSTKSRGR